MRLALMAVAVLLPAGAAAQTPSAPLALSCPSVAGGDCKSPPCSNDARKVGDECMQWPAVDNPDLAGYVLQSYGVDCLQTPAGQLTALVSATGCFGPGGTASMTVLAFDTGGLRSLVPTPAVTFDSPVVCLRHTNCRDEIDPATGLPEWTCDGCESRCSPFAPLFTTRPPCP